MGRIKQLAESTEQEVNNYLDHLDWDSNPFTQDTSVNDYVLPSEGDVADVIAHVNEYTGPLIIHSQYSGVGKTTLVKILLDELSESHQTIFLGEHNVTPYELVSIIADKTGVGKSSSTKLTEEKLGEAEFDEPILLAVDEFGLNDPGTLHSLQFLNDETDCKIILTGMTSQWDALQGIGSDGKAFQRRVSFRLKLTPFTFEQTEELVQRRIASVTDTPFDEYSEIDYTAFITKDALQLVYDEGAGVAGVIESALADALSLIAYRHTHDAGSVVTEDFVDDLSFSDPHADISKKSE